MQTRRWVGACVMSVAIGTASVAMAAQDTKGTASDKRSTSREVTMSGCLEGPINTGDEYARSAVEARFRLSNVTMTPASKGSVFILAGDGLALAPHVGRQVQIVATMVDAAQPTGTSGSKQAAMGEPTVRVQSVRRIADKCSTRK